MLMLQTRMAGQCCTRLLTSGQLEVVKWLVEKGADVNATNKDGRTVLHSAADSGQLDVVKWLVEKGADVNATDKDGKTVLHMAAEQGSVGSSQVVGRKRG